MYYLLQFDTEDYMVTAVTLFFAKKQEKNAGCAEGKQYTIVSRNVIRRKERKKRR